MYQKLDRSNQPINSSEISSQDNFPNNSQPQPRHQHQHQYQHQPQYQPQYQQPINNIGYQLKIGQSGPINWQIGANCQRIWKQQFSQSIWNPLKLQLRQKIQAQLLQQRQVLNLKRDVNRLNLSLIPIYIGMVISILAYSFALKSLVSDDQTTDDDIYFLFMAYIMVILFLLFVALGITCYFTSQMRNKVETSICFLNQKLSQEGYNLTVMTKKKCPFPTPLNFSHVEIYERTQN